jgi:hypothetical protein
MKTTAQTIKLELKKAFPGVKFGVTGKSYAGGDSVRVSWTDGPTEERVNNITCKYEYGSFDGMTDIYNYDNVRNDIPQTKYLFLNRSAGEQISVYLSNWIEKHFLEENGFSDLDRSRYLREEFSKLNYPEKMFQF